MEHGEKFNPRGLFKGVYIPDAIARMSALSMGAKVCYARLCWFADDDGDVDVNQLELANSLGVGERQVRSYLDELTKGKFIEAEQRGRGQSNLYTFLWHAEFSTSLKRGTKIQANQDRKDTAGQKTVQAISRPEVLENEMTAGPSLCNEVRECIENSIPLTPFTENDAELPDAKTVKWRLRDAGFKVSTKDLDALVGTLSEIAADRGACAVVQLVDQFPDHCRRMDKEDLPNRDRVVPFFLGYLRKWHPDSPPEAAESVHRPVDTNPEPIVTPAGSQGQKNTIVASAPDPVDEFLKAWDAGPCAKLRLAHPTGAIRSGVRSCLKVAAFRDNQAEIIRRAHELKAKGQDYITLSLLLRDEKWAKLLNGDYDWSPLAGGRGGRHDVTSGPDALAAYAAKLQAQIDEEKKAKTA